MGWEPRNVSASGGGRGKEWILPWRLQEGTHPIDTLIFSPVRLISEI